MSFSSQNGYEASTITDIMQAFRENINAQFGTSYTDETFAGTGFYKYFYAIAQRLQLEEVKTSEIFLKVQQYFAITNEAIQRPVGTNPGIVEALSLEGYVASVKPPADADAGKIFICVDVQGFEIASLVVGDLTFRAIAPGVEGNSITIALVNDGTAGGETVNVTGTDIVVHMEAAASTAAQIKAAIDADADAAALVSAEIAAGQDAVAQAAAAAAPLENGSGNNYDDTRLDICGIIRNSVSAGIISQGDQVETIVLSNGQSFDFKYGLPNRIPVLLKLTLTLSENNQVVVKSPEEVKDILLANIAANYSLGKNFEPQKYFGISDAPWCSQVLLEWSDDDGGNYYNTVYDSPYNDLFEIGLENITVVEA